VARPLGKFCTTLGTALALAGAPLQQSPVPVPPLHDPPGLPARVDGAEHSADGAAALGARLFFDPILSLDRTVSCGSCHRPELAFADAEPRSKGVGERRTARNTPSLLNRAYGEAFMWDGRAATLEEQVLLPIENPDEMALPLAEALTRLAADMSYRAEFERLFAGPPRAEDLAHALAAYVRRLVLGDSPVDRFRAGDFDALGDDERAGLWFYESRGRCWRCHSGANFSDEDFHNTGVGAVNGASEPGRAAITGRDEDRGRFKTPTLRGLALTAPYMHDGSLATLEDVVAFYRQGGHPNPALDPALAPI
jgi:cytochrome c peroxidase